MKTCGGRQFTHISTITSYSPYMSSDHHNVLFGTMFVKMLNTVCWHHGWLCSTLIRLSSIVLDYGQIIPTINGLFKVIVRGFMSVIDNQSQSEFLHEPVLAMFIYQVQLVNKM